MSSSTISASTNSSGRSRRSITVTSTPSAANIDAYSMPITPAPTTAIERGRRFRPPMSSLVMIVSPFDSMSESGTASVPLAMSTFSAEISRQLSALVTRIRCGSTNAASPHNHVHAIARQLVGNDRLPHALRLRLRERGARALSAVALRVPWRRPDVRRPRRSAAPPREKSCWGSCRWRGRHSPDGCPALDQRNTLAQLRRLNGAALACRTAANADQVVVEGIAH